MGKQILLKSGTCKAMHQDVQGDSCSARRTKPAELRLTRSCFHCCAAKS